MNYVTTIKYQVIIINEVINKYQVIINGVIINEVIINEVIISGVSNIILLKLAFNSKISTNRESYIK